MVSVIIMRNRMNNGMNDKVVNFQVALEKYHTNGNCCRVA